VKIGILTFHRVINDGSTLQTYCLWSLLKKRYPNAKVEIIDYMPYHLAKNNLKTKINRRFFSVLLQQREQLKFLKDNCNFTKHRIVTDNLSKGFSFIKEQNYDCIFVGSDTVWDLRSNGWGAPKPPNLYFLSGIYSVKKIAFAASMDKGYPSMVQDSDMKKIISAIDKFDFISVRDLSTKNKLIQHGLKKEVFFMPDPTLLWDIKKTARNPSGDIPFDKNIAGISVTDSRLSKILNKQLIDLGYEVINLLGNPIGGQFAPLRKWTFSERLGLYKHLSILITDRFHGSIFAMVLGNTPVLMVEPDYYYMKQDSKGRDLFERLDLMHCVWRYNSKENISNSLISEFLDNYEEINVDIKYKIQCLFNDSENHFKNIDLILSK
tara:strand:+ start:2175 stop:3311 length:1137 start_codon:yes stop_codon:yes gene_type:complete